MKSRLLAVAVCIAVLHPLAGRAVEKPDSCRFASEEIRQQMSREPDSWSAGWVALDRGDIPAAQSSFDRALAERPGDPLYIIFIAALYREGSCGMPKDLAKVASLYRDGAAWGEGGPMLELALMLWQGHGVPEDREAAVHLFRQGLIAVGLLGGNGDIPELKGLVKGPVPQALLGEFDWVRRLADTPGMGRAVATDLLAKSPPEAVAACRYMALSFERHKDAETAYRLGMMHLGHEGIAPSRFYAYLYLHHAAMGNHPAANAEIGRRLASKDVGMQAEWQGLAWLLRARRLGHDVRDEIEQAKRGMPAAAIREAELQALILPPFDGPAADGSRGCIKGP